MVSSVTFYIHLIVIALSVVTAEPLHIGGLNGLAAKEWISARYTFAMLAFFGFLNFYTVRINLSVAIVAMVRAHVTANGTAPLRGTCPENGEFTWDTRTQGIILGAFYYGYILTQIPASWIVNRFGAKQLFGLSGFLPGVLALLTPIATRWHFGALITIRVLQGVFEGVCFPCAHRLIGKWTPPLERTRIVSIVYNGMHVGTVVTLLLSGVLGDYLGWESIFYFFGGAAVLWYIIWLIFAYESPSVHPRISQVEKDYIERSIGISTKSENIIDKIPWRKMFCSKPVWAIAIGHFGNNWGYYTLSSVLPTYLSNVLHFRLKENGVYSAIPYLVMATIMPISGYIADMLRRRHIFSTTNVRRIFHMLGVVLPAGSLVAVGYVGCDVIAAMVLMTVAVGCNGFAWSAGFQANPIDLSPTFGGILIALSNTLATVPGIVGVYVAGAITTDQTTTQWLIVFYISAGIYLSSGLFYVIFCSGESQGWDNEVKQSNHSCTKNTPEAINIDRIGS